MLSRHLRIILIPSRGLLPGKNKGKTPTLLKLFFKTLRFNYLTYIMNAFFTLTLINVLQLVIFNE